MRCSKLMRTAQWFFAALALHVGICPVAAQTKDPAQAPPIKQTPAPPPSDQRTPQQSPKATSQTPTTQSPTSQAPTKAPRNGGIKIDPIKATKTIIDIFGKKKKPKETPQAQPSTVPAPVPETSRTEPVTPAAIPAAETPRPQPKATTAYQPPVKNVLQPPPPSRPSTTPLTQSPAQQAKVENAPEAIPKDDPAPAAPTTPVESALPPAASIDKEGNGNEMPWTLIVIVAAMAAVGAAAAKWFLFPTVHWDMEILEGESGLGKTATPFVTPPESSFDVDFEWGVPTMPRFAIAQGVSPV